MICYIAENDVKPKNLKNTMKLIILISYRVMFVFRKDINSMNKEYYLDVIIVTQPKVVVNLINNVFQLEKPKPVIQSLSEQPSIKTL